MESTVVRANRILLTALRYQESVDETSSLPQTGSMVLPYGALECQVKDLAEWEGAGIFVPLFLCDLLFRYAVPCL